MRLKIIFETYKLPILYRHRFIALIKEALNRSDPAYKRYLYPEKSARTKKTKPFTFGLLLPPQRTSKRELFSIDDNTTIEDTVFYFTENRYISFYISSCDYQFITNFYNGLLDIREFRFDKDIVLRLKRIFMLNEKKITNNEVLFKTNAPILIEDEKGKPILPPDLDTQPITTFNMHFNAIHERILKDLRSGQGLYRKVEFTPVRINKQVVKHTLQGFREKTSKPYMMLTCFEGYFKLKGDPQDLQMLYQIGIGLRTGQGFGMVEAL